MTAAKRVYRALTDEDILSLLRSGHIYVDTENAVIWKNGRQLRVSSDSRGQYLTVEIYDAGGRKKIMLHRLVWMAAHWRVIPDGYEVHHKRGRSRNGAEDLELLTEEEHRRITYGEF